MRFSAVIVAAGSGSRAGPGEAKQWRLLGGRPVLAWSVVALRAAGADPIVVVTAAEDHVRAGSLLADVTGIRLAEGGATRADSVMAGLLALQAEDPEIVLVHDAARPFVTSEHVARLLAALEGADGAVPVLPMADTLKREAPATGLQTVSREGLMRVQTPQAFRYRTLAEAYAAWSDPEAPTDDAAAVERAGGRITSVAGDPMLMKLTYAEDFAMAEALASARRTTRIGQGFDAHRFGEGEEVWLCGVRIPHSQGLVGHSDADAGLHALTDALLGAVGAGDIGEHFPPSDPKWRGVSSDRFVAHALDLVAKSGGAVVNADITLICEAPKIAPHRQAMRARVAELLSLPIEQVSVKATTTETMGFTGRREGLAAQAVVAIEVAGSARPQI